MTKLDTQLVHGPAVNDNCTGAVTTPIYKATTFEYPEIGAPVTYDYSWCHPCLPLDYPNGLYSTQWMPGTVTGPTGKAALRPLFNTPSSSSRG